MSWKSVCMIDGRSEVRRAFSSPPCQYLLGQRQSFSLFFARAGISGWRLRQLGLAVSPVFFCSVCARLFALLWGAGHRLRTHIGMLRVLSLYVFRVWSHSQILSALLLPSAVRALVCELELSSSLRMVSSGVGRRIIFVAVVWDLLSSVAWSSPSRPAWWCSSFRTSMVAAGSAL